MTEEDSTEIKQLKREITQVFGDLVQHKESNVDVYDTSPDITCFVSMRVEDFRGRLDSDFILKLERQKFSNNYRVRRFAFGFDYVGQILIMELHISKVE